MCDDNEPPDYAILSHRWEDNEVLYECMQHGDATPKSGFRKISEASRQALNDDLHYIWIDTCCIDEPSGSEPSEAVSPIFAWYQTATTCYAYLSDVQMAATEVEVGDVFERSVWFTMSWTLQELLAPAKVMIYDKTWRHLGSRDSLE